MISYIHASAPSPVAKTLVSKVRNSRPSLFKLKAAEIHETLRWSGRQWATRPLPDGGLSTALDGCAGRVLFPGKLGVSVCAPCAGRCKASPAPGGAHSLGGRPLKAALTLPAARRPGLGPNPDLEAEAVSRPPPTARKSKRQPSW